MGKNQHSKDRLFITSTEWKNEYGGKKNSSQNDTRALPFDCCALSLAPYHSPCCIPEGVVFDVENLVPFVMKHRRNPVTGAPMTTKDIIRLNMSKNADDKWHCPVTCKVFNNNTHVVAIKTSGNVFSYEAVQELNFKSKNFTDLLTGESFTKADVITLQNPQDAAHVALRDINSFVHLKSIREERNREIQEGKGEGSSKVRQNPMMENVMKEIEKKKLEAEADGSAKEDKSHLMRSSSSSSSASSSDVNAEANADVRDVLLLQPTTEDVEPGKQLTSGKAGSSLTSSAAECWTGSAIRLATAEEIREARWRKMRTLGKKGYVQLQTSVGNLNLEIHCDIVPMVAWNFITLCERGLYDGTDFHRMIPGFMLQGGDPSGTGSGGQSAWGNGNPFKDVFDSRLLHNTRGIMSMANSGRNTNKSQFFITFKETPHLDYKHSVFGRLVGGAAVLDRIEAIGANKKDEPLEKITLLKALVFTNPIHEADEMMIAEIRANMNKRLGSGSGSGSGMEVGSRLLEPGVLIQAQVQGSVPSGPSSSSSSYSSSSEADVMGRGRGLVVRDGAGSGLPSMISVTSVDSDRVESKSSSGRGNISNTSSVGKYLTSSRSTAQYTSSSSSSNSSSGGGINAGPEAFSTSSSSSTGAEGDTERPTKKMKSSNAFSDFSSW